MADIEIKQDQIDRVKAIAASISEKTQDYIDAHSTVSVERTILRLFGVDGMDDNKAPYPNRVVDELACHGSLEYGVARPFAGAMLDTGLDAQLTAEAIAEGRVSFKKGRDALLRPEVDLMMKNLAATAVERLDSSARRKKEKILKTPLPPQPWRYIIVATGDIYDDRTQALAAIRSGADIIAVIRSTVQSLLDYVPYGATTEGFGGTFATQENFRVMRKALDEASAKAGRYIMLVNYSSGLCMAEIAACAALEDLDILLNDSMYGILFRNINMRRTFVDQYFSRRICARARIMINTGEDNYLTTADAIDNARAVTASQLINEAMAKRAGLTGDLLGMGHAFEIDPDIENAFLYELAHASLTRKLFPGSPVKYMPPTKHMSGDIFISHCLDTMFNLASITTRQGIHLAGILTEAVHNPLMQDRAAALDSIDYIFRTARSLGDEIEFKKDGLINKRAQQTLDEAESLLEEIESKGLDVAISEGRFADVVRKPEDGRGLEGVFAKGEGYCNPVMDLLEKE